MPTYEYECTKCGHTFELVQSFSDKPRSRCPLCRGRVRKVIHAAGIIFKGDGWYATDSRSSDEKTKFKKDGKSTEKPEAGGKESPEKAPVEKSADDQASKDVTAKEKTAAKPSAKPSAKPPAAKDSKSD